MRLSRTLSLVIIAVSGLTIAVQVTAKDPIFVRWLAADDPGDQVIRQYWERAEKGELKPEELVDLGTMLFKRGYPKDAVRYYHLALKQDPRLYEAWFRIGLAEHKQGDLRQARQAYQRCLKQLKGHGWCNFYMGLLHEQTGQPKEALHYYSQAFLVAPELSDPKVNPEVLYSELYVGALVEQSKAERFVAGAPMGYLQPAQVGEQLAEMRRLLAPPPTSTPEPVPSEADRREKEARRRVGERAGGADTRPGGDTGAPRTRVRPTRPRPEGGTEAEAEAEEQVPRYLRPMPTPRGGQVPSITSVSGEAGF
jgi:tetratricopeptide (TPR) repeat protein